MIKLRLITFVESVTSIFPYQWMPTLLQLKNMACAGAFNFIINKIQVT